MGWWKIGGLCGLKAIVLACLLTPTAAVVPVTPAYAQFQIIIPGFGGFGNRRYYGRRHYRQPRRVRRNGGDGEIRPAGGSGVPKATEAGGGGGKKIRGTSDN